MEQGEPVFYDSIEPYLEDSMSLTKEELKKLNETHDAMLTIRTVLLGADGQEGLCKRFEELAQSHYHLKKYFWLLVGVLVGSGVIAGSIIGALNGG